MTALITPAQCRMARAGLRWTLDDLVEASGVGRATIQRFEADGEVKDSTVQRIREALEAKRVKFVDTGPMAGAVLIGLSKAP